MLERVGLMNFVPPNFSADAMALLIDAEKYSQPLRELMPSAQIQIRSLDALPHTPKSFDVIIADDILNDSKDTYILVSELRELLKESGFLLTQFFNARFIVMLEHLRRGRFPTHEQKFWTKWDVVKLLSDAHYKEIHFIPAEKVDVNVDSWVRFGFENFNDDLLTKTWFVKASRCTEEVAALKELYSDEVRAELARLIHRVEYGIEVEENFMRLLEICRREKIFEEYLFDFIAQIVTHDDAKKFFMERRRSLSEF